jgi:catechol 2,3-dioxygenase-like lactoylglutathione lyase family enzyme
LTAIPDATQTCTPSAPAVLGLHHITVPCSDLVTAEEFYVGLLGARVLARVDAVRLTELGWTAERIRHNRAAHIGVQLGTSGPRLDLFDYPEATDLPRAPMHPHIAMAVPAEAFTLWQLRLSAAGVPLAGPARLGPPGQASFYFNDPFGNHLEILTTGIDTTDIPVGVPERDHLDHTWRGLSR